MGAMRSADFSPDGISVQMADLLEQLAASERPPREEAIPLGNWPGVSDGYQGRGSSRLAWQEPPASRSNASAALSRMGCDPADDGFVLGSELQADDLAERLVALGLSADPRVTVESLVASIAASLEERVASMERQRAAHFERHAAILEDRIAALERAGSSCSRPPSLSESLASTLESRIEALERHRGLLLEQKRVGQEAGQSTASVLAEHAKEGRANVPQQEKLRSDSLQDLRHDFDPFDGGGFETGSVLWAGTTAAAVASAAAGREPHMAPGSGPPQGGGELERLLVEAGFPSSMDEMHLLEKAQLLMRVDGLESALAERDEQLTMLQRELFEQRRGGGHLATATIAEKSPDAGSLHSRVEDGRTRELPTVAYPGARVHNAEVLRPAFATSELATSTTASPASFVTPTLSSAGDARSTPAAPGGRRTASPSRVQPLLAGETRPLIAAASNGVVERDSSLCRGATGSRTSSPTTRPTTSRQPPSPTRPLVRGSSRGALNDGSTSLLSPSGSAPSLEGSGSRTSYPKAAALLTTRIPSTASPATAVRSTTPVAAVGRSSSRTTSPVPGAARAASPTSRRVSIATAAAAAAGAAGGMRSASPRRARRSSGSTGSNGGGGALPATRRSASPARAASSLGSPVAGGLCVVASPGAAGSPPPAGILVSALRGFRVMPPAAEGGRSSSTSPRRVAPPLHAAALAGCRGAEADMDTSGPSTVPPRSASQSALPQPHGSNLVYSAPYAGQPLFPGVPTLAGRAGADPMAAPARCATSSSPPRRYAGGRLGCNKPNAMPASRFGPPRSATPSPSPGPTRPASAMARLSPPSRSSPAASAMPGRSHKTGKEEEAPRWGSAPPPPRRGASLSDVPRTSTLSGRWPNRAGQPRSGRGGSGRYGVGTTRQHLGGSFSIPGPRDPNERHSRPPSPPRPRSADFMEADILSHSRASGSTGHRSFAVEGPETVVPLSSPPATVRAGGASASTVATAFSSPAPSARAPASRHQQSPPGFTWRRPAIGGGSAGSLPPASPGRSASAASFLNNSAVPTWPRAVSSMDLS